MSSKLFTFQQAMDAYRNHLMCNPGKALDTGCGIVALLDYTGDVYGAVIDPAGRIDRGCAFDFDAHAFNDGHWDGQTVAETVATIDTPRLIDFCLF
jgi:hypothetical protein